MKSSKLWMGIPLIILVFTVLFTVILTSCDPLVDEEGLIGVWNKDDNSLSIEFTKNRLFTKNLINPSDKMSYYYKSDGKKITVTLTEGASQIEGETAYQISGTTLTISQDVKKLKRGTYTLVSGGNGGEPADDTVGMPYVSANPPKDNYNTGETVTVTIVSATNGATIRYTDDGTAPTTNSTQYTVPFTITSSTAKTITIKAFATKSGLTNSEVTTATFTFVAGSAPTPPAQPTASPGAGAVASGTTVTLSTTTSGADIYYTTNNSEPSANSGTKGTTVTITAATTIKAIAIKDGVSSTVLTAAYTIQSSGTQTAITVNNGKDSGDGSLRKALADIANNGTITIAQSVGTIALTSGRLEITKNVTIKGNGVIITRGTGFPANNNSLIENGTSSITGKEVNIECIHFKEGKDSGTGSFGNGAAIYNYGGGSISINSCIFTLNETNMGGAIYNAGSASAFVRGCTFYSNKATTSGGAIYHNNGTLTLTGNIFYMNTAPGAAATSGPIVFKPASATGTISGTYNIVDVAFGTGTAQCGWTQGTGDQFSTSTPFVSTIGSNAYSPIISLTNIITPIPTQFPTTYFDGSSRGSASSPGAVK